MVDTQQSRRPHPTTSQTTLDPELDRLLAEYRCRVTAMFAGHRHLQDRDGGDTCTCGAGWPCVKEELAAQLLDDWV